MEDKLNLQQVHQMLKMRPQDFRFTALDVCSELAAEVSKTARRDGVTDVVSGYTSKPVLVELNRSTYPQPGPKVLLYIDVFGCMRDFTPTEKEQSAEYGRSSDAAHELQRLLADCCAVLAIAADGGLADLMLEHKNCRSFTDEICFAGQEQSCGTLLICLSLVPLTAREERLAQELYAANELDDDDDFVLRRQADAGGGIAKPPEGQAASHLEKPPPPKMAKLVGCVSMLDC